MNGWPAHLFVPRFAFSAAAPELAEVQMETEHGDTIGVRYGRWHRPAGRADLSILARCEGPVLDVGCGPGRHVAALVGWGRDALGIDTCSTAIVAARQRGAPAAEVSVFGDVPRAGLWGTALLLDGNIGIGGDVASLLIRVRALLRPRGVVLVETASPSGRSGAARVRIRQRDTVGDWFPWAWVTPDELDACVGLAGLHSEERLHLGDRWFVQLRSVEGGLR